MTKEANNFDTLTKVATILTKIFEVLYSVGAITMTVAFVLILLDPVLPGNAVWGDALPMEELRVQGFSIRIAGPDGAVDNRALMVFLLGGALILELMAWVFRNVNLILRTTQGLTKFSKGKTPFQKDNVRMMREIGIFFISIAVVELAMSGIAVLILGPEMAEVSADLGGVVIGILMLCLSQVFAMGQRMQEDVDGLV